MTDKGVSEEQLLDPAHSQTSPSYNESRNQSIYSFGGKQAAASFGIKAKQSAPRDAGMSFGETDYKAARVSAQSKLKDTNDIPQNQEMKDEDKLIPQVNPNDFIMSTVEGRNPLYESAADKFIQDAADRDGTYVNIHASNDEGKMVQAVIKPPKKRNFKDHLILGPVDKYVRYGLFPWKFMVHIILLFLTAAQIFLLAKPESNYQMQIQAVINDLFLRSDGEIGRFDYPSYENGYNINEPITIYTIDEMQSFVKRTRDNYYGNVDNDDMLLAMYPSKNTTTGEIDPIRMYVMSHDSKILQDYNITNTTLGPFDNSTAYLKNYCSGI